MQPPRAALANERGEKVEGFKISKSSHLFMSLIVAFIPGGGGLWVLSLTKILLHFSHELTISPAGALEVLVL